MDFHYRVCPTLFLDSYFVGDEVLLVMGRGGRAGGHLQAGVLRYFFSLPPNPLAGLPSECHLFKSCLQREFNFDLFSEGPNVSTSSFES